MLVMESVREGKEGGKGGREGRRREEKGRKENGRRGGEQEIVPDLSESVFCL